MEAISSLGINWRSLISQIVNFLVLLALLRIFLYRPILTILDNRREKIKKGIEDAEAAKAALEEAEKKSKEIIRNASKKAEEIIASAKSQSKKQLADNLKQAKEKAKQIIDTAKIQAESERKKIINSAKSQLGEIIVLTAEKIIREKSAIDSIDKILTSIDE